MTSTSAWKAAGSYFEFKGQQIFFREDGPTNAPVLLLIHGFPTASWDYDQIWPVLTKKYRVLALDMLGFGFSSKPRRLDYRISEQADIQQALLRRSGVREYHFLAHDYGVSVGQELVARDLEGSVPTKLRSACFLNGGLFPETHHRIFLQSLLLSRIGWLLSLLATKNTWAKNMRAVFGPKYPPTPAFIDGLWELLRYNHGNRITHKLIKYIPDRIEHRDRWVAAIQRQDIPIRLIDGVVDPISGGHMARHYRELVPNAD